MWKSRSGRKRHCKDHVQRDPQLFGAMDMCNGWRVGDDGVCEKEIPNVLDICRPDGFAHSIAGFGAASPRPVDNLPHLCPSFANITGPDAFPVGEQARIPHHVGHECFGIAANGKELDALSLDKVLEGRVRADAHSMLVRRLGQDLGDWDEGLDVAAGTDYEYCNVQWGPETPC